MGFDVLEEVASTRGLDLRDDNVQILLPALLTAAHAAVPFGGGTLPVTPRWPVVIDAMRQPVAPAVAATVLDRIYPPDHALLVLTTDDDPPEGGDDVPVGDLVDLPSDILIAVIPSLPVLEAGRDPRTLQHIVARLRQPDGCPWDRKQTTQSLRGDMIEELYEAVDAIDAGDMANLAEELGDLLLLVMMQAQIAEEAGAFTLEDVFEGITRKIVRRHPHVFGDAAALGAEDVVGIWQRVKDEERGGAPPKPQGDGLPRSLPTLERASRVLRDRPLDPSTAPAGDRGADLLAVLAGIIADGDDPDVVLREVLDRHVKG